MQTIRRTLIRLLALAALATALPAAAQATVTPLLQPQPTENPAKIEVIEFFSYACGHCANLSAPLEAWTAKQPSDVLVKRVAVPGGAAWTIAARLYYTLEITGDLAKLDGEVFKAIHEQRVMLFDEKKMLEWLATKGVNTQKFGDVYKSFSVQSRLARAEQLSEAYRKALPKELAENFGVPAIFVDGRFLVGGRGPEALLANTEKLIAQVRAERAERAKKK